MNSSMPRNWRCGTFKSPGRSPLDQVICDPDLAQEFDNHAARLAPGYTPLEYRWAALGLRKKPGWLRKGKAAIAGALVAHLSSMLQLTAYRLRIAGGLYLFSVADSPIFLWADR